MSPTDVRESSIRDDGQTVLAEEATLPDIITVDITGNDISFPFEWCFSLDLGTKFVQITLVDDRIAIHKPTAKGIEYTKPCKAGENSYIRSMSLFGVRVPKPFLETLGIRDGGKADLTPEENCMAIRKHPDVVPELPEPPVPIMALCCACGRLLYTESGLVKLFYKYICHECIETVKAL